MSDIIREVMPDWNGRESIVAYSIRQRRERDARLIAKMQRDILLIILSPAIMAAVVGITFLLYSVFSY